MAGRVGFPNLSWEKHCDLWNLWMMLGNGGVGNGAGASV